MSMVVAHNIPAINANKNLYTANRNLNSSLSKLSSGFRINTGQDGPADLVISEQLRSQTNGLERAVRNTTESINVLSIAEGALNEMNSILKKMKALAIHSANNGVTSPDQIAADQAEMDSGIQTLERIANSTKYSDQFLLNGSKDITYSVNTSIVGTQNNRLTNTGLSTFSQIFKRDGYNVSIGFNGATNVDAVDNIGNAAMNRQAARAYLEIDVFDESKSQVNTEGILTQGQSFILTGTLGSRQFRFSEGAKISEVVSAIHNVAGSTGVDASLIFNRTQTINVANGAAAATNIGAVNLGTGAQAACQAMIIYNNTYYNEDEKIDKIIASGACLATLKDGTEVKPIYGLNTDGNGDVYIKLVGSGPNASYEIYKDASLSKESLIGTGVGDGTSTSVERNNSQFAMQLKIDGGNYGDVIRMNMGNIVLNDTNAKVSGSGACAFRACLSTAAGVRLGQNTDGEGKIYIKTVYSNDGCSATVYAYNNALMREQDMVAKSACMVNLGTGSDNMAGDHTGIVLDAIWNDEKTANTGLGITLALACASWAQGGEKANTTETMEIQFTNLGARIFSTEYGSDQFIKVQQFDGGLFVDYEDAANYDTAKLIEKDTTFQKNGQDATITVNGQQMKTRGLGLSLATPDIQANITFNSGKTGSTTLAQVGYGEGTIFTKATSLTLAYRNGYDDTGSASEYNDNYTGLLNNAGHNTNEKVDNFQGGMQLQLGEGSGDQERTVIGLKSMSTAQLGRLELTGQWDKSKAVIETRTLSIQDVMGGSVASLSSDPTVAMKIIDKAINDVSELRAQIGAVQANMLQTNENNLRVAIENITKTESAIRDTDMASEMTAFTSAQILSNAGVSMLGQANAQAQQVMGLLQ